MSGSARIPVGIIVFLLWLAGLAAAAQFAKISAVFPAFQSIYPDAGASLGFLVSLLSLVGIVLGVFTGLLAARIGLRRMLVAALLLGSVLSLLQASLPTFPIMLASRVLEGLSHLAIVVAAPTLISQASPAQYRPAAMTLWGTFFGVSFSIVAWFGVPLAQSYGVPSLLIVHGTVMAGLALILRSCLPPDHQDKDATDAFDWRRVLAMHKVIYTSPHISAAAFGWLFYTFTYVSLLTVLPEFIAPQYLTLTTTAMPLASIVSSLTIGVWLLSRYSAVALIQIGFALSGLIALYLIAVPGDPVACIALFAALGLVQGASFSSVPQLNAGEEEQAYAYGGMAQTGNLGNAIGTPILLMTIAMTGFSGMMVAVIGCYLAGLVIHAYLHRLRMKNARHAGNST